MQKLIDKLRLLEAALPPEMILDKDYLGLRITEDGKEAIISIASSTKVKNVELLVRDDPNFMKILNTESLLLHVVEGEIFKPQAVMAGSPGFGQGLNGYGTLGWFIYLDDQLVGVSNYHVLCASGDNTPLGTPVFSGNPGKASALGSLHAFDALGTAFPRLFDFAMVAISDLSLISAEFVPCESGAKYQYPTRFGTSEDLRPSENYYTVGARAPMCSEGKFRGIGSALVGPYPGGQNYYFSEQLFFDSMSKPGDSGSLIVQKSSNCVIGLLFAGIENQHTLANPIYRKGWTYAGTKAVKDIELPYFLTNQEDMNDIKSSAFIPPPNLDTSPLPPIFNAGRRIPTPLPIKEWMENLNRNAIAREITVIQPLGEWVQIKVHLDPHPAGDHLFINEVQAWLHTSSGIVYGNIN